MCRITDQDDNTITFTDTLTDALRYIDHEREVNGLILELDYTYNAQF